MLCEHLNMKPSGKKEKKCTNEPSQENHRIITMDAVDTSIALCLVHIQYINLTCRFWVMHNTIHFRKMLNLYVFEVIDPCI